jgi:transmembrane sensor
MPDDLRARMRARLARDQAALEREPLLSLPRSRRRFLQPAFAVAGAAAVLGGAGYFAWQQLLAQPQWRQAFATERGQQKDIPLPDGSRLRLDTATRVEVVLYRQRREVRLHEGQAVFSVQADAARPFEVLAGPLRVTVVGTRFSVRHTPGQPGHDGVTVAVEQGKVRVARADAATDPGDPVVFLTPGQQVASDAQGTLGAVGAVPAAGIAPWREQRLSFIDMPLGQALAELARYGRTGLVVRDPQVAALRLTGTFDPLNRATLRLALPRVLPVRLQQDGPDTEVLLAR